MTFLTIADVAAILGPDIKPKTVSQYLYESKPRESASGHRGRYVDHPFPAPDGYIGRAPWWKPGRSNEIIKWRDTRPGKGVGGGRPRKSAEQEAGRAS